MDNDMDSSIRYIEISDVKKQSNGRYNSSFMTPSTYLKKPDFSNAPKTDTP